MDHFLYAEGGVEPRPYGIVPVQDGRHSIVNEGESGVSFNSDHGVSEKNLLL